MKLRILSFVLLLALTLSLGFASLSHAQDRAQPSRSFYVAGEVIRSGEFEWKEGMSLRKAISLAEGVTYKAALRQGVIFRKVEGVKREEIKVDIGAVMNGKVNDISIEPDDVIVVPNSRRYDN